jgi:hypothetical protein
MAGITFLRKNKDGFIITGTKHGKSFLEHRTEESQPKVGNQFP